LFFGGSIALVTSRLLSAAPDIQQKEYQEEIEWIIHFNSLSGFHVSLEIRKINMPSTRKIIRAFLASPSDLQEERKAIRDVVEEFNASWANELGYQVELMGWEETIAGFGRPQHLINQDLDRCDLFLGMIWKRWGTPPDHDGNFTSGFEEEFERSMARREKTGSPEVSLFFKQVPDEFMVDPGDDLKKVLEFREKIIAGKKILYQGFSIVQDIEKQTRKCVTAYVNRIRAIDESSELDELRAKSVQSQSGSGEATEEDKGCESSPLSSEGFGFLESLVERIRQPDSLDALSASDVARFRLLANSVSKSGNDEINLGVHDINILFAAHIKGTELGKREKRTLLRLGFQHLANENVPLWCWYSARTDPSFNPAVVSSLAGDNDNEKVGAISVLMSLALDLHLPADGKIIPRDNIIAAWFSDDSSARVRAAALGYLAKCGTAGDLEVAKNEYARSDYGTSRSALECMVGILLRTGQTKAAQELVLESQFESLNTELLRSVLVGFDGLETSDLLLGLEHSNHQVRFNSMKSLLGRGELEIGAAERLIGDSSALVRNEAVKALLKLGKPLIDEEVKKILVPPRKQASSGVLGLVNVADPGKMGEELYRQYQLDGLKKLSEAELVRKVEASLLTDDEAYFALVERYFRNHADKLRRDVDDRFKGYFEERMRRIESMLGNSDYIQKLVKDWSALEEYLRKEHTRRGLDVLCAAQKSEDLQRIRANLRDGYAEASWSDAEYLGRFGVWTDIPILANAKGSSVSATILPTMLGDKEFQVEVARAITSISKKHSVSDLLFLEMPAAILTKTIELCPESRFAKISKDALLTLFNHESEGVRKAAAVQAIRSLPTKQIKSILSEYVGSNQHRYYNVIHWLDLGASMSRAVAKSVARVVSN
jgi:hypothetical protein